MNREIKFRGKDIKTGEWRYGYYVPMIGGKAYILQGDGISIEKNIDALRGEFFITEYFYQVHPESVGQFVAPKDKDGKECFEGDIVKFRSHPDKMKIGEVFYMEAWGRFAIKSQDDLEKSKDTYSVTSFGTLNELEIIGNIHDNPELLK